MIRPGNSKSTFLLSNLMILYHFKKILSWSFLFDCFKLFYRLPCLDFVWRRLTSGYHFGWIQPRSATHSFHVTAIAEQFRAITGTSVTLERYTKSPEEKKEYILRWNILS